jgi:putative DNA primase/helicase
MGRYLAAHGIEYRIKPRGDVDLYVLKACLFDANHRGGEAAIVTGSRGFGYQCFHASCAERSWKEARAIISGDKSLAEWCEGFDPHWQPPKKGRQKALPAPGGAAAETPTSAPAASVPIDPENPYATVDNIINPICSTAMARPDGSTAPSPMEIETMKFFAKRGSRMEFVPRFAANYLYDYLSPLAYSAGQFWQYKDGVWKIYPEEQIASVLTHALKERVQGRMIEGVLTVLRGLIYVPEDRWEPDPYMINVKNGMLDIRSMVLRPHSADYYSRVQLPVTYNPEAPVGEWYAFLESIFPEDHEKDEATGRYKNYLNKHVLAQQFAGYCLLRDCRYQKAMFLYGSGSNGKSTFLNVIGAVLGAENTCSLSLTTLGERFKSIYLHNKMANLASETNPKAAMESDIFNSVVAGDEITAEEKYGKSLKFRPFCKFIISMNESPMVQDKSYAFERRVLVLNFNRRFTPEEIDPQMSEKLMAELDGVFNWMVEGLKILLKRDAFVVGANIQEEIDQMMSRVNPFITFTEDCCILGEGLVTRTQEMWEAYRDWCKDGGNRALGRNKFLDQVLTSFPAVTRTQKDLTDRHRVFKGIGLATDVVDEIHDRVKKMRERPDSREKD